MLLVCQVEKIRLVISYDSSAKHELSSLIFSVHQYKRCLLLVFKTDTDFFFFFCFFVLMIVVATPENVT